LFDDEEEWRVLADATAADASAAYCNEIVVIDATSTLRASMTAPRADPSRASTRFAERSST
jgi:hypothetical protein